MIYRLESLGKPRKIKWPVKVRELPVFPQNSWKLNEQLFKMQIIHVQCKISDQRTMVVKELNTVYHLGPFPQIYFAL